MPVSWQKKEDIQINTYRVIYEAIEDVKAALSGMLDPDIKEVELGQAEVRSIFKGAQGWHSGRLLYY